MKAPSIKNLLLALVLALLAAANSQDLHDLLIDGTAAEIQAAIDGGADLEAPDEDGWSPLMIASAFGTVESVQALLDAGADTEKSKDWYERVGFTYKRGDRGMHWFALGDGEIMLHPGGGGAHENAADVHVSVVDLDALFERVIDAGLQPLDHQRPGVALDGPVTRPWGYREFELRDPDGQLWAFTEVEGVGG